MNCCNLDHVQHCIYPMSKRWKPHFTHVHSVCLELGLYKTFNGVAVMHYYAFILTESG